MNDAQELHDAVQIEILNTARKLGADILFESHQDPTQLGYDVIEVSGERAFICSFYFRNGVEGDAEVATYTRRNIETFNPHNLYWVTFNPEHIRIEEYFLDALVLTESLLN